MEKDKRRLVWSIEEDAQAWPISQEAPQAENTGQVAREVSFAEWRLAALVTLFCVLLAGGWMWHRGSDGHHQAGGEVTILAQREVTALEPERLQWLDPRVAEAANQVSQIQLASESADLQVAIQATNEDGQRTMRTHVIDFDDDVALVEVITSDADEKQSYRQTRVFRRTHQGWQRIVSGNRPGETSEGTMWGVWQTWETGHLSIRYLPIDAAPVAEVAPKLDQFYNKLQVDFGLPVTATVPTITIEIVPSGLADGYTLNSAARTMQVPSPASLLVPVEMTAATVFYQSVVYPLSGLALAQDHVEASDQPDSDRVIFIKWKLLSNALRFWALWEASEPPLPGREDLVRWLYQNGRAEQNEASQALLAGYDPRCRTYPSWEVSPVALKILLDCKARLSPWREPTLPTHLVEQFYDAYDGLSAEEGALLTTVALETVIEYVVATYGRDYLPRLITAMEEHDSWQSLIPALFATSAEEFEAGWQAYLANRYE